jgi:hypothetical protein
VYVIRTASLSLSKVVDGAANPTGRVSVFIVKTLGSGLYPKMLKEYTLNW